jgi:hypothetical protein
VAVTVGVVELESAGATGASVETVLVAAEVCGGEEVSGEERTVDVDAPRTAGDAARVSAVLDTAGVEVELTNGGALTMLVPSD